MGFIQLLNRAIFLAPVVLMLVATLPLLPRLRRDTAGLLIAGLIVVLSGSALSLLLQLVGSDLMLTLARWGVFSFLSLIIVVGWFLFAFGYLKLLNAAAFADSMRREPSARPPAN
jgi:hypothetical protein